MTVKISPEDQARRDQLVNECKCVGCEESVKGKTVRCGLCNTCYMAVMRNVKAGKWTTKELVRTGHMLPPQKGGRKPANKFTKKLSNR